jgi:hypothetical protein
MSDIVAKLNELSEIQAAVDVARVDYETKRAEIMRTVLAELDALEAEYEPLFEASRSRVATLTEEIKQAVVHAGASVKGAHLYAVYSKGRVTWDTRGLDKFALAHPEVTQYRKQGEPSVSLRTVKEA